jgi:hypothetical protein
MSGCSAASGAISSTRGAGADLGLAETLDRSGLRRDVVVERTALALSRREGVFGVLGLLEKREDSGEGEPPPREMCWTTLANREGVSMKPRLVEGSSELGGFIFSKCERVSGVLGVEEKREGSAGGSPAELRHAMRLWKEPSSPSEAVRIIMPRCSLALARCATGILPKVEEGVLGTAGRSSVDVRRAAKSGEGSASPGVGILLLPLIIFLLSETWEGGSFRRERGILGNSTAQNVPGE